VAHQFDHEKLDVYQTAIAFVAWTSALVEGVGLAGHMRDQLERASASIPLNIAEGNGKFASRDRRRFFEVARGSAFECAGCLHVLVARKVVSEERADAGKAFLQRLVAMLTRMVRQLSERVREEEAEYEVPGEETATADG
jgi:four helix bundle protein